MLKAGVVFGAGIFLAIPAAWAVETLSTAELASHCEKYHDENASEDRIFCVRYIQGFIDGAIATDKRVMENLVKQYEKEETFSERATRTRIGSRLERTDATFYAEFCLGDPVQLKDIVELVVTDANNNRLVAANPQARDLVYQTLRKHYPCQSAEK